MLNRIVVICFYLVLICFKIFYNFKILLFLVIICCYYDILFLSVFSSKIEMESSIFQ